MNPSREKLCSGIGCTEPAVSGGYCRVHHNEYQRNWRRFHAIAYKVTRGDIEALAGRTLTNQELTSIGTAIENSSIPEALATVIQGWLDHHYPTSEEER